MLHSNPQASASFAQSLAIEDAAPAAGPYSQSLAGLSVPPLRQTLARWRRREFAVAAASLAVGDAASFGIAGFVLTFQGPLGAGESAVLAWVAIAVLAMYKLDGLYPGYGIYPYEILRRRSLWTFRTAALAAPVAACFSGLWSSAGLILAFLVLAAILQTPIRVLVRSALRRCGVWGVRAQVTGPEAQREAYKAYFHKRWQLGIRPVTETQSPELMLVANFETPASQGPTARRKMDEVLLASAPGLRQPVGGPVDLRGEIGFKLARQPDPAGPGPAGRAVDLALACLALTIAAPVLALAALAIYVADPGPVLYKQTREGFGGRRFFVLKLRTMYCDADLRLQALLDSDAASRAEWARHYKLRHDPRVLPLVGAFLRASSIDELPQFLNVLLGDMRIVGPRPFPLYHLAAMEPSFREKRCTVTPGLTGLWQVSGRSGTDIEQQQDLDDFYIDNRSFWLDVHIIACTASAVARGEGAY